MRSRLQVPQNQIAAHLRTSDVDAGPLADLAETYKALIAVRRGPIGAWVIFRNEAAARFALRFLREHCSSARAARQVDAVADAIAASQRSNHV